MGGVGYISEPPIFRGPETRKSHGFFLVEDAVIMKAVEFQPCPMSTVFSTVVQDVVIVERCIVG